MHLLLKKLFRSFTTLDVAEVVACLSRDVDHAVKSGELPNARYQITAERIEGRAAISIQVSNRRPGAGPFDFSSHDGLWEMAQSRLEAMADFYHFEAPRFFPRRSAPFYVFVCEQVGA